MERMLRDLTERYFIKSACKPDEYVHEYISKLLPREIDYFKSKNIFSEVIKTDILVQLVGFSWEPLFISLCAYQPETLVLVLNKEYNDQLGDRRGMDYKEHINKLKEANLIINETKIISDTVEDTPESVFKLLREKVLPYVNEGRSVVIDITGAKKSMVSGAYLFATYSDSLVSYLDFGEYSVKYGRPYGYTCVIKKPENPVELFKLNEWLRVKEQYNRYAFGNALRIINSIEKETMEFIGFEGENAVELLKECLRFYEVWDNGDYRAALEKYKTITAKISSFPCPSAVQELGEVWFTNEDPLNTVKQIEGEEDINQSIYLQGSKVLIYAQDELNKIARLIRYKEDHRSALLRAIGLNDFLFKARLIKLWVNNQLQIEIDNKTLKRDELDDGFRKTIDKNLLRYSTFDNIINLLRKGKPFILRVYDPKKEIKVHCLDKTPTMEKFWNDQKPNPYELFKLRNKAIHFCLSVSEEIAKAAFNLAKTNLEDLRKNWVTQSIASGVYEALQWDDLCEQCGINFLPRRKGNENG